MLDIVQRYAPIVDQIKKDNFHPKKIVEIGGGGEGVGSYLTNFQITDCDIKFVDKPLPNTKIIKLTKRQKRIPLKNNSADVVICVDTIEHLPTDAQKQHMINELLRIAKKKVYISVPTGQQSLNAVRKLYKYIKNNNPQYSDHYIEEHILFGHPTKHKIKKMILKANPQARVSLKNNANIKLWLRYQKIYRSTPKLWHIFKYKKIWYYIMRPIFPLLNFGKTMRTIYFIELD